MSHKVISTFSHQLFVTGFVHGDPHPGNVFVRPSPQGDAEIVLLDHGLYITVEEDMRISLCRIWKSIVQNDREAVKLECEKVGVKGQQNGQGNNHACMSACIMLKRNESELWQWVAV